MPMIIETYIGRIAADYFDNGSDSPLVIIAHGKGGHRNTGSKKIAEYLNRYGISTLRIDLYGHGESDGKYEDITITTARDSILGVIKYAQKHLNYRNLFLFGTSYGGNGILGALPYISTHEVSGIILRCTVLNYLEKTFRDFSKQELLEWKNQGYRTDSTGKLNYSFVADMEHYQEIDYAKLAQFETVYFYAGKDTKVLRSEVDQIKNRIPNTFQVITYPDSEHAITIPEDLDDMMTQTRDFIYRVMKANTFLLPTE